MTAFYYSSTFKIKIFNIFFFIILFIPFNTYSQLKIKAGLKKKELINFFQNGSSIKITKIKYKGAKRAIGTFRDSDSIFNMYSGLVLSSGSVKKIAQKNESQSSSSRNYKRGYKPLNKVAKGKTKDAAVIEISFIPKAEFISFNFVFGSEEYPEYVKSTFNDAFAFFLKPSKGKTKNLAVIPNTKSKIAINSVNHIENQCYYINNSKLVGDFKIVKIDTTEFWSGKNKYEIRITYNIEGAVLDNPKIPVEFDGFTKLLQAKSKVIPGEKYKLIICIADAGDRIFDTGVLIEAGSFLTNPNESFKFGALANDTNYYFKTDTVLVYSHKEEEIKSKCRDTSYTIYYNNNESEISLEQKNKFSTFINNDINGNFKLSIESYTDEIGSKIYNNELSENRRYKTEKFIKSLNSENIIIETTSAKGIDNDNNKTESEKRRTTIYFKCN